MQEPGLQRQLFAFIQTKEIHLTNLNEDAMLSGVITHFLVEGENKVGKQDGASDIVLAGLRFVLIGMDNILQFVLRK